MGWLGGCPEECPVGGGRYGLIPEGIQCAGP